MNKINIALAISLIFLLTAISCTEKIDINTSDSPPQIVIYGSISTDTTRHQIRITRSAGYFSTSRPEGVSEADIRITYADKSIPLTESTEEKGLYLTASDVYGISGESYTLHVSVDFDRNGKKENYEATTILPHPSTPDSFKIIQASFGEHFYQLNLWGQLSEENEINYISIQLYRNNVLINDSLKGVSIADDEYIPGKYINGVPIFVLNQDRERSKLEIGDTIMVSLKSITKDYATFINNAQTESQGSVPIFGGPPANIETNIRCTSDPSQQDISGYFTAYSIRRHSLIFSGIDH